MVTVAPLKTAVLILDLQNEIIHEDGKFGATGAAAHAKKQNVVVNAAHLAAEARAAGIPVIHVSSSEVRWCQRRTRFQAECSTVAEYG